MKPRAANFVFSDGVTAHKYFADAAAYYEHRETLQAFDLQGRAFEIPPFADPIPLPGDHRKDLIRRLRHELLRSAVSHPERLGMNKWEVKQAADDEIIDLAVRWFTIPEPTGRLQVVSIIVTILLSPLLAVLYVLFWIMLVGRLVVQGARKALGDGCRSE